MQEGGSDIIELGVPFSDPIADGPAIQETNTVRHVAECQNVCACSALVYKVALKNNVDYNDCLNFVRDARQKGLKAPVLLMGLFENSN